MPKTTTFFFFFSSSPFRRPPTTKTQKREEKWVQEDLNLTLYNGGYTRDSNEAKGRGEITARYTVRHQDQGRKEMVEGEEKRREDKEV